MKKLLKKSLSCILALTLIVSALPMFAVASESETEPTNFNAVYALSVRSKSTDKVTTALYTYKTAADSSNHRVSFLKFDFTGLSNEQIHKIGTASLNIYKSSQKDYYAGLKVSVLPENLENWDNLEYYVDASEMLSTSIPVVSTDETDKGELDVGYKTVDNLGDAIAEHLISDSDDKIVCFRLEGVAEDLTTYSNHTSDNPPYISLTFDGTYRFPKATIYDGSSTRGTSSSNQEIMGKTIYTQANSANNTRYAFYKFDFSAFSTDDLYRVSDMTLNLYYYGTSAYTGVKVAVLPAEMEDWTSVKDQDNTLSSTYAHSNGMISVQSIAENTDKLNDSTLGWKPVSGLGDAIVQHLFSDTDDKIVAIRVDAYQGTVPCQYTGLSQDVSIQPYISATPVETDEEYLQAIANSISFASISSQPVYAVTSDLNLSSVTVPDDIALSWTSSDTSIISSTGVVTHKLNAKPVTLTATISLKSDPSISVTKSFRVTTLANDGAEIRHYWDFDNDIGLNDHYDTAEFMSENTYDATVGNDLVDSGNKVAVLNQQTTSADNYLTFTGQINSTNARYIAISTDIYDVSNGNAYVGYRYQVGTTGGRTAIISTKNSLNKWESYLTVIDMTTPENSARYVMENNAWTKYDNVAEPSYRAFGTTGIDRITVSGIKSGATMYFDNFSVKAYEDFYAEVNAATEANVIAVIESFDNMGIIELPVSYASADKAALATAIKAKVAYASDDEIILAIEKALSDGSIIIGEETVSENVLTQVKFATKASVANTNIKFVAASYTASNELVAVSVADVASVSDGWNTATLNLDLSKGTKIKYMLWSDIDTTIVPIVKVSEK